MEVYLSNKTYLGPGGPVPGSANPKDNPKRKIVIKITKGITFKTLYLLGLLFFSCTRSLFNNVIILQYYKTENNMKIFNSEILMK